MRCRLRRLGRLSVPAAAVGVAVLLSGALASAGAAYPPCFGAASRDPYRACHNPNLDLTVIPTPSEAQIMPNSPCAPVQATINLCTFGVPVAQTHGTIALVDDSHAWHWRAAVEVATDALDWQAFDTTRSSCPFTAGVTLLPQPKRSGCIEWNRELPAWFAQHPEVSTVFVSSHPAPVVRRGGQSLASAQIAGYIGAWRSLPSSVKHIVVIRDIPYMHENTLACIEAAIRKREDAGVACAVPRAAALRPDPEVQAAEKMHSPRVQVIDLTKFFCGARLCYPVVGGALVYRDADHLTRVFAATVGPFLLHSLGKLMASWG